MSRRPRSARPARRGLATLLRVAGLGAWALAINGLQNLALAPRASRGAVVGAEPRVSILVPARDEAANIAACLRGLLAQRLPAVEIIVLDDGSTDATAAIVRRLAREEGSGRLRLLPGAARPAGWTGKNWACQQLAEAARGDWLLFTDADTRHGPDCLAAALALACRFDADLVSLLPRQVLVSPGERLIVAQLPLIIDALLPLALVPRLRGRTAACAGAFGPYLLFRRTWYDRLGGHAAVRGALAEDLRFALATRRAGGRLVLADGSAVLACRMYRTLGESWRGLARNALPAALGSSRLLAAFALAWTVLFVVPPAALLALAARRLARRRAHDGALARLALAATGGQLALRLIVGQRHGWPLRDAALQPLGAALLPLVLLDSWRRHRVGGVIWRGRACPLTDTFTPPRARSRVTGDNDE